ncbi:aspartyl-phosphate phosphatase Spo0E family protein [Oceanobacillus luteolus]|uniref:Aspartyl-phosphate phosphatase Spo0E family protein n=1 Tax=Oceanobacillus luteolus TaxID=1274358 RepID=A0ABW4HNS9_9BACI|nr:aspartyl-phosphate phosphatase Spo0E family protein [Oceanobacillus luteolus]
MSKLILLEKIEACREELISLSSDHDLTSQAVIESSMKLDTLIYKYQNYDNYELASR